MNRGLLRLFGITTPLVFLLVTPTSRVGAQTNFTLLRSFSGIPDGGVPWCTLVSDKGAVFYGTTAAGGISNYGTVFRLNTDGSGSAILKSFTGPDGTGPLAGLVLGSDGNLFGTTYSGGTSNFGTVFRMTKEGNDFAVLHSFVAGADGQNLWAGLIEGSDGALYGATYFANSSTRGTIFRLNKDGTGYSILHTFTGTPDGQQPTGKLLEGTDGTLYGTTVFGGSTYVGTLFSLQKDGSSYTILHNFSGQSGDGASPEAGLVEGSDGVLYGTTGLGSGGGDGTVFRINKDGSSFAVLWTFSNAGTNGNEPDGELVEGADGALYGTTRRDGSAGYGTIFKLNKDGSGFTILRAFSGLNGDGENPSGGLLELTPGVFYGTMQYGGEFGAGCIYAMSLVPLPPRGLFISTSANSNLVQFAATSAIQYDVLRSTDLTSWSVAGTVTSPTNGQISFSDLTVPQPAAFYRLRQH